MVHDRFRHARPIAGASRQDQLAFAAAGRRPRDRHPRFQGVRDVEVDSPALCGTGWQPAADPKGYPVNPPAGSLRKDRERRTDSPPQVDNLPHKAAAVPCAQVRSDSSGLAGESPPRPLLRCASTLRQRLVALLYPG